MVTKTLKYMLCTCILSIIIGICIIGYIDNIMRKPESTEILKQDNHFIVIISNNEINTQSIYKEALKAKEKYGALVEFHVTSSIKEQYKILEIAQKLDIDGIILYPIGTIGYDKYLQKIRNKGIPIMLMLKDLDENLRDSYIGSSERSENMVMLNCVNKANDGSVLVIDKIDNGSDLLIEYLILEEKQDLEKVKYSPKTKVDRMSEKEILKYKATKLEVIEDVNYNYVTMYKKICEILDKEKPSAIFSYNPMLTEAISAELTTKEEKAFFMGYGQLKENLQYVSAGIIDGLLTQNNERAIDTAIRCLVDMNNGNEIPKTMDTGLKIITKDNYRGYLN